MFPCWTIVPTHWQHDFTCFCTLRHYVIVNLNVNENHMQYVHSKTNDTPGKHSTQSQDFLIVSTKTGGKKYLKINDGTLARNDVNDVWATWESIGMLTAGMSARDVAWHFQRDESTISQLLNRFQKTGTLRKDPDQGDRGKTTPRKDRFLTTSSRRDRFLSSRKLGRLLRNATGTRVCDRTVRNRLHAARLKACCPYVGIPLTWRNYRACCCTVFATT